MATHDSPCTPSPTHHCRVGQPRHLQNLFLISICMQTSGSEAAFGQALNYFMPTQTNELVSTHYHSMVGSFSTRLLPHTGLRQWWLTVQRQFYRPIAADCLGPVSGSTRGASTRIFESHKYPFRTRSCAFRPTYLKLVGEIFRGMLRGA